MQWNNSSDAIDNFLTWIEARLRLSGIFAPFKNILVDAESYSWLTISPSQIQRAPE
jgi:hypothetical protein